MLRSSVATGPKRASAPRVRGAASSGREWPDAGASSRTRSYAGRPSRLSSSQPATRWSTSSSGNPGAAAASTWKVVLSRSRRASRRRRSALRTKSPSTASDSRRATASRGPTRVGSCETVAAPSSVPSRPGPTSTASTRRRAAAAACANAAVKVVLPTPPFPVMTIRRWEASGRRGGSARLIAARHAGCQFRMPAR